MKPMPVSAPRTNMIPPVPAPRKSIEEYEENIIPPPLKPHTKKTKVMIVDDYKPADNLDYLFDDKFAAA